MKRFILLLLFIVLLFGCSAKPDAVTKDSATGQEIQQLVWDNGMSNMIEIIVDEHYGLPTEGWVTDVLFPELFKRLKQNNLWQYQIESNDCDDFAARARLLAQELNNQTSNRGVRALAVGEYHYIQRMTGLKHALNFAVVKSSGKLKLIFFEPQTGEIAYLTEEEIASCFGWII